MTYQQKLEELRRKSLRIIERGLNTSETVSQFYNAIMFLNGTSFADLNKDVPEEPDALDAEELIEKENKQ